MPTHGKISSFDPATETWSSYCERLAFYFIANDLTGNEAKKKAILLSVCGGPTFDLMKNLLQPEKLADKTYGEPSCSSGESLRTKAVGDSTAVQIQHPSSSFGGISGSICSFT